MKFTDLISRADDEVLLSIIGSPAVRMIRLIDPALANPSGLRRLVLEMNSPASMLLNSTYRNIIFDLLRNDEAVMLASVFGIACGAPPYGFLKSVRFQRGSEKERILFDFFELTLPPTEPSVAVADALRQQSQYPLFPHQRAAARDAIAVLSEQPNRVLLHMPTGAGKTRTAMNVIADHLRAGEPRLVVWLAYGEELCEQALGEFNKAWQSLGNREISVCRFWGAHSPNLVELRDGFVVAGLAKLYRAMQANDQTVLQMSAHCTLIVMDEAHQAVADTYRFLLDALFFTGRQSAMLGLTATPGRSWNDVDADQELAQLFSLRKVGLHIPGFDNPVEYLTTEGYLAKAAFTSIYYAGGALSDADIISIESSLDIPARILRNLAKDDQRNLKIIREALRLAGRHKRILIFASSVAHSDAVASVLAAKGIGAASVTDATKSEERTRRIDEFKSDRDGVMVLVNYGILTTGFDAPKTSAVLIARPTKSLVLYSQMVGRAIRGPRAGGNETAEIVTVVDSSLPGFGSIAQAFANWEDVWKN